MVSPHIGRWRHKGHIHRFELETIIDLVFFFFFFSFWEKVNFDILQLESMLIGFDDFEFWMLIN